MAGRAVVEIGGRRAGAGLRAVAGIFEAEAAAYDGAVDGGVRTSGSWLQGEMRRQSRTAGLGRVSNSWKVRFYGGDRRGGAAGSGRARAAWAYTKASRIMKLAETGGTVRARQGRFLAIPTKNVPRRQGRRADVEKTIGRILSRNKSSKREQFKIVPPRGSRPGLVIQATRRQSKILFFLVRQTRHRKKIDFAGASRRAADRLPGEILERLPR